MTEKMHVSRFNVGEMVSEKITGIKGRVVAITFWETGCNHIGIKQLGVDKDGKPHDMLWFDEPNIDPLPIEAQAPEKAPNPAKKVGGPLTSGMSYSTK